MIYRILFLLLFPLAVFGQKIDYYPKVDNNYNKLRDVGFAVRLPVGYNTTKQWTWGIAVHGIGERSAGTQANLENLMLGFDYDGNGTREGQPFLNWEMQKAGDQYGIVWVVPTYDNFMEPELINKVYDFVRANYTLLSKFELNGFSLGGGAVIKYITSNSTNAGRVYYANPCAPTRNIIDASLPGKAGIAVHIAVNDQDDNSSTNLSVTKGIINSLNASNPALPAIYTAFRKNGHGGYNEFTTTAPPKAPGGQGLTDAAENIYQVTTDIVATGKPRQMKSGEVIPPPVDSTVVPPSSQAIVTYSITGNKIKLDGSKSTGYTSGLDGVWQLTTAPTGLYSWDVFPGGSGYIVADGVLSTPGRYSFAFKLKGDPVVQNVSIDFGKVAVAFDSATDLITYSDNTTERGTAVCVNGAWTVRNSSGQIINLVIKK